MPPIHVMIKPAGGLCNMRCRYCFYADEMDNRQLQSCGSIMEPAVLEAVIRRTLAHAERQATIAFQGGEPTLAGLDFFRLVVELEKKHNTRHIQIDNALQTNGYVIDEEWAKFLAENHFLVGLSLDGPKDLHDLNRLDAAGKGTYSKVMHAVQLLKNHHVEFNTLTVVTRPASRSFRKIYGFFDRNDLPWQQYIPCLDPLGQERGGEAYSLRPEDFTRYLKDSFDCWYRDVSTGKFRYHRYFTNLVAMLRGQPPEACGMMGVCGMQYVVEADGSVYPCDFYCLDQWKLGNFLTDDFDALDAKREELGFIRLSAQHHPDCLECPWRYLCRGGCRRDREEIPGQDVPGKNYYCESYKEFFAYAAPRLEHLARGGYRC